MDTVPDLVRKAQAGDHRAFGQLVTRFQDLAFGYALRWLRDAESARDAAQDAFVAAFLSLHQLEEPAAFAGWFRRVLLKQCDRRTRRAPAPAPEECGAPALPDQRWCEHEERAWLRSAVEELPPGERMAVALHYFGDEPQEDVADFLELPLSTLKKRLYVARRRLEARRNAMETHRPSKTTAFADAIRLFLSVRSGDEESVTAVLGRQPQLIEARESWSVEEALHGSLPMPNGATPLVSAAARGDRDVVAILLAGGARPDGPGGRYSGESALLTAALHGYADVVEALLAAGADANAPNTVGHTPVHAAALHGHAAVLTLLEAHGGRLDLRARNGKTAADYLRERRPARRVPGERLETGIKAVDLFASLATDMLVRVMGAGGTGSMVLLGELARRLADVGRRSIWVGWEPLPWQKGELSAFVREVGIDDATSVVADGDERLRGVSGADAALFVFQREGHQAEVEAALPWLARRTEPTFVVDPWAAVTRGDHAASGLTAPFDALICTSPALAAAGLWPAIDPERTCSNAVLDAEHARIQRAARELLRGDGERAAKARAFLTQPFTTWQHHTGRPGEIVPLADTLLGIDTILSGSRST